jgi:crotonobetainyl-CoA:carnitine CoA-transferase CaiB-like acyl-CoA transferase
VNDSAATPTQALAQVLHSVAWDRLPADHVTFTGSDPVLRTNFPVGTAGAAAIAAAGLAAADLWELRSGRRQSVAMDVCRAAVVMRSSIYTQLIGKPKPPAWDAISGLYRTADGRWIQLHCNYPHHRDGALRLLGCREDRAEVARAIERWDGLALEDAMTDARMVAALSRTAAEWAAHPHAHYVDRLPLLQITRIGASDPEALRGGARPLAGCRALDLTRVLAGPTCGRTLAEHGADVMRISAPHLPFIEHLVMDTGHGKLAAHVDLRTASGRATLEQLIRGADVFTQGYRPGTLARRGFSPDALAQLRPGIVYVSLSAYGEDGPWGGKRGFDTLVQGVTGITVEHGGADKPMHLPVSVLDYASGYLMAFGAMVALGRRAREGGSYHVRVSLVQTAHWLKNLGRVSGAAVPADAWAPNDPALAPFLMRTDTPFGPLGHLAPAVALSETPPYWARPVVPLGTHAPQWPPREDR